MLTPSNENLFSQGASVENYSVANSGTWYGFIAPSFDYFRFHHLFQTLFHEEKKFPFRWAWVWDWKYSITLFMYSWFYLFMTCQGYISLLPAWIPYFWISFALPVLLPHFSALGDFLLLCCLPPRHFGEYCSVPSKAIEVQTLKGDWVQNERSRCHEENFSSLRYYTQPLMASYTH